MSRIDKKLVIEEIYTIINEGTTSPVKCRMTNGVEAVAKYQNNRCGTATLVNELLGYSIAEMIGVSAPDYGLCSLSNDVISLADTEGEIDEYNAGTCFFTILFPKEVPTIVWSLVKECETEKIILLDHILNNFDRHIGNIFFDFLTKKIYVIDFSHIFSDGAKPDYASHYLYDGMNNEKFLYNDILTSNAQIYDTLCDRGGFCKEKMHEVTNEIQHNISKSDVKKLERTIPKEWKDSVGSDKIRILTDFINFRIENLDKICNMIIAERGR